MLLCHFHCELLLIVEELSFWEEVHLNHFESMEHSLRFMGSFFLLGAWVDIVFVSETLTRGAEPALAEAG